MEEQGMVQQDLVPILGPKSRVSEIMNRKRKLTMKEIEALHKNLKIPLEVFFTHDVDIKRVDGRPAIKFHNSNLEFRIGAIKAQSPNKNILTFIEETFYRATEKLNDFMLLNYSTFIKDIECIILDLEVNEKNEVRMDEQVTDVILDRKKHPDSKRKSIEVAIINFMRQRPDIPTFFKD